ncbi:hypothetical protein AK88_05386, partial [Plasmodium fragile]
MQRSLWKDIEAQLGKFMKHLDDPIVELYAANCLNQGYTYPPKGKRPIVANVGDRIMCTLMSAALNFMNGWGTQSERTDHKDTTSEALKEHIRCAIVNRFMYILLASPCRSEMGVYYAWHTVKELEKPQGGGLITKGKCGQGVFENIKASEWDMGKEIKDWLEQNPSLNEKFSGQNIESICRKSLAELDRVTPGTHTMHDNTELREKEKEAIQTLSKDLKLIVEEVKTAAVHCAKEGGECMAPSEHAESRNPENADSEATAPNYVGSGKPARPGKEGGTESSTPATPQGSI